MQGMFTFLFRGSEEELTRLDAYMRSEQAAASRWISEEFRQLWEEQAGLSPASPYAGGTAELALCQEDSGSLYGVTGIADELMKAVPQVGMLLEIRYLDDEYGSSYSYSYPGSADVEQFDLDTDTILALRGELDEDDEEFEDEEDEEFSPQAQFQQFQDFLEAFGDVSEYIDVFDPYDWDE